MARELNEIIAHIRMVAANPNISTTLIQTEDLEVLCTAAEQVRASEGGRPEQEFQAVVTSNEKMRAALVSVKKWIMDPNGPDDFNSKSLHPAFLKALKKVDEALNQS